MNPGHKTDSVEYDGALLHQAGVPWVPMSSGGVIVREKEPVNLEMPFGSIDGFITPTERFYVRCHFPIPKIDPKAWRLKIEGDVEKPLELTYDELLQMEAHTITLTMECAGNGRAYLTPQVEGAQWEGGAVGNAEWTGVLLSDLLKRTGVRKSVHHVIFEGADQGEIKEPPRPAGKIHYARSLSLQKANEDVLLAFKMNGEVLTPAHGFPLRAIVPGWYGMAAVKWLTRIIASVQRFNGYYQSINYAYWERGLSAPTLVPIQEMQVKAQIARPEFAEAVRGGQPYRVHGAAWTSEGEITKVEVSTDCGETWQNARLQGESMRNVWRLWEYDWQVPANPGKATLMARATDSENRTSPAQHDDDRGSYIVNHWLPIEVDIR